MREELEQAGAPSIELTGNASLEQSATGGIYLSYRKFLYSPDDEVPGSIYEKKGPARISARKFVLDWMVRTYGADGQAWPPLAHRFVSQPSDDK